jgi:hypothetical protein
MRNMGDNASYQDLVIYEFGQNFSACEEEASTVIDLGRANGFVTGCV